MSLPIQKKTQGSSKANEMARAALPDWLADALVPAENVVEPSDMMNPMGSVLSKGSGLLQTLLKRFQRAPVAPKPAVAAAVQQLPAEFTPVGGEPPYHRPTFVDPTEAAYQRVLKQQGRKQFTPDTPKPSLDTPKSNVAQPITVKEPLPPLEQPVGDTPIHNPLVRLQDAHRGGTSVIDPSVAKEKSRLMLALMDRKEPFYPAIAAMHQKAPITMGHTDTIRFGEDAVNEMRRIGFDDRLPLGNQQSGTLRLPSELFDDMPDSKYHMSEINLRVPDEATAIHELTHSGQQIRHGKDFADLYMQAGGGEYPGRLRNPFEINADKAANNYTSQADWRGDRRQQDRLQKRLAQSFRNIGPDGEQLDSSDAPAEVWGLERDVFHNMVRRFLQGDPDTRRAVMTQADAARRANWPNRYRKTSR